MLLPGKAPPPNRSPGPSGEAGAPQRTRRPGALGLPLTLSAAVKGKVYRSAAAAKGKADSGTLHDQQLDKIFFN